jgi:hypothetical protein
MFRKWKIRWKEACNFWQGDFEESLKRRDESVEDILCFFMDGSLLQPWLQLCFILCLRKKGESEPPIPFPPVFLFKPYLGIGLILICSNVSSVKNLFKSSVDSGSEKLARFLKLLMSVDLVRVYHDDLQQSGASPWTCFDRQWEALLLLFFLNNYLINYFKLILFCFHVIVKNNF